MTTTSQHQRNPSTGAPGGYVNLERTPTTSSLPPQPPPNDASAFTVVHFFCQVCHQPIKLDPSLLDPSAYPALLDPITSYEEPSVNGENNGINEINGKDDNEGHQREESTQDDSILQGKDTQHLQPPSHESPSKTPARIHSNKHHQQKLFTPSHMNSFVLLSKSQVQNAPWSSLPGPEKSSTTRSTANNDEIQHPLTPSSPSSSLSSKISISHRLNMASNLFDLVSGTANLDHPLCIDCSEELLKKLDDRLAQVQSERSSYAEFLEQLETESLNDGSEADFEVDEKEMEELLKREQDALKKLKELSEQRSGLKGEIESLEGEMKELDVMEASFWQEYNEFREQFNQLQDNKSSLQLHLQHATEQLEKLKKTNVYNDTFRIWHEGPFGTINGFRLGRLPSQPVDWAEINAGLGQTLLLLDVLAKKLNYQFKIYNLIPLGSYSKIEKRTPVEPTTTAPTTPIPASTSSSTIYELYHASNDLRGILFWNRRFDHALVHLLACVKELGDYAESKDAKFKLPYRIHKDKIGEISIKLQFNHEETWTKALKYVLINLKWLLAFCTVNKS